MDPVQKVQLDEWPDLRQMPDVVAASWRAYARATQEPRPVEHAGRAEMGPGVREDVLKARTVGPIRLHYEVGENGEVLVKVIDAETGLVLRTVPPDELARYLAQGEQWDENLHLYL